MREFVFAVASARVTSDTGPPSGYKFRSSKPSSSMARSATGLLLGFLTLTLGNSVGEEDWVGGECAKTRGRINTDCRTAIM